MFDARIVAAYSAAVRQGRIRGGVGDDDDDGEEEGDGGVGRTNSRREGGEGGKKPLPRAAGAGAAAASSSSSSSGGGGGGRRRTALPYDFARLHNTLDGTRIIWNINDLPLPPGPYTDSAGTPIGVNTRARRICAKRAVLLGERPTLITGPTEANAIREFGHR